MKMIKTIILVMIISSFSLALLAYQGMNSAEEYYFDGLVLGDSFKSSLGDRKPYDEPCDIDPVDGKKRRMVIYTALNCKKDFPDNTSIIYYLKYSDKDPLNQPVKAFAFLRGRFFVGKSNFPFRPGLVFDGTIRKRVLKTFILKREKDSGSIELKVHQYHGNIYCLTDKDIIAGFAFGDMPDDPKSEQWQSIIKLYDKYTPKFN